MGWEYCLSGDTLVLMGRGRLVPIADVRAGDQVYGTRAVGRLRRYAVTEVLDHWQTVKAAYQVELDDGTAVVASGDHRFLTDRGWKHVTDAEPGLESRPFLTTSDMLVGIGGAAASLDASDEFRIGYLTGMTRAGGGIERDTRLGVVAIRPLGVEISMFDISTGTGDFVANGVVSHNCAVPAVLRARLAA